VFRCVIWCSSKSPLDRHYTFHVDVAGLNGKSEGDGLGGLDCNVFHFQRLVGCGFVERKRKGRKGQRPVNLLSVYRFMSDNSQRMEGRVLEDPFENFPVLQSKIQL
jgi:hypothetical protein